MATASPSWLQALGLLCLVIVAPMMATEIQVADMRRFTIVYEGLALGRLTIETTDRSDQNEIEYTYTPQNPGPGIKEITGKVIIGDARQPYIQRISQAVQGIKLVSAAGVYGQRSVDMIVSGPTTSIGITVSANRPGVYGSFLGVANAIALKHLPPDFAFLAKDIESYK